MALALHKKRLLIVGNWKMNFNAQQASILLHRLHERIKIHRDIEVVLAPSSLHIQPLSVQIDRRKFRLAAQNAHHKDSGAYTGEISFTMLNGLVHYAIIGHSERRHIFHETLNDVRDKVAAAVRNDITPIICVGETQEEYLSNMTARVLNDQLTTALSNLTAREVGGSVIAYEPVWAIGSGKPATPAYAQACASKIRNIIKELYGPKAAGRVRIIYGGSTNASNARSFLDEDDIDGLLPGGSSLNYQEFSGMIEAAYRSVHKISIE